MSGLYTYAIMSNLPKQLRCICAESLIIEAMRFRGKTVAVNLDGDLRLVCASAKATRDDPMTRFGKVLGSCEAPVLAREDFSEYLREASRQRTPELTKDRSMLLFLDKPPSKEVLPAIDAMCFLVSPDHSSIPFIYSILKAQAEGGFGIPVRIVIVGEPYLERAAEFFIGIKNEIDGLRVVGQEFGFAGNIYFDQDQFELAIGYNQPLVEAFSGGSTHGQIRYIVNRLLVRDLARVSIAETACLERLGSLLNG